MKKILISLFAALLCNAPSFGQDIDTTRLNQLLTTMAKKDKFMGSIAILDKGEMAYHKSVGFAAIEEGNRIPATTETRYRIGSVSKMFTATMIFQLIEDGKLSMDTPLSAFYPEIPNADQINIRQMLSHRSGLHNFTSDTAYGTYFTEPKTHEQIVEIIAGNEADFEPGDRASYSNANYVLLGYIIEKADERPYEESLKARIIYPADLRNTYFGTDAEERAQEAESFTYEDAEWVLEPETHMSIPGGAGAIVSTSGDLVHFAQHLFTGKLISKESLSQMKNITEGFGMGVFQFPFGERIAFGHSGGIDGFVSHLSYFPSDSVAVAMVSNGINYDQNNLMIGVLSIAYDLPYEIPSFADTEIEVPEAQLRKYTGLYTSGQLPIDLHISLKEGNLFAQGTDQPSFPLQARTETTFSFDRAGVLIEFVENENGEYDSLLLNQGGGQYRMTKEASSDSGE